MIAEFLFGFSSPQVPNIQFDLRGFALTDISRVSFLGARVRKCELQQIVQFDLLEFALTDNNRVSFLGAGVRKCEL